MCFYHSLSHPSAPVVHLYFLATSICVHARKPSSEGLIAARCGHLSNPPVVLGHQVDKEMTNPEYSGLMTRWVLQGLAYWPKPRCTYVPPLKAIQKEHVLLAAVAPSDALFFGVFWLGWQDVCQATPRMEADIILDPGAEKPTERVS